MRGGEAGRKVSQAGGSAGHFWGTGWNVTCAGSSGDPEDVGMTLGSHTLSF